MKKLLIIALIFASCQKSTEQEDPCIYDITDVEFVENYDLEGGQWVYRPYYLIQYSGQGNGTFQASPEYYNELINNTQDEWCF